MSNYRNLLFGLACLAWAAAPVVADSKAAVSQFTFKDLDGHAVTQQSLAGHPVIVDIWATYCEPCKAEMADFMNLAHKYKPQGLEIVGISVDQEGAAIVKPFVDRNHIDYPILVGDVDGVEKAFQPLKELPTAFFVDGKGNIQAVLSGKHEMPELEKQTRELIGIQPGV